MKILLLGSHYDEIGEFIESCGDNLTVYEEPIRKNSEVLKDIEFIVSYGYRHIIKKEVIELFRNKIINLHISYLPYNRGADPNLWSFLEATPKGVTIHFIDEGVDTGEILLQKEINMPDDVTLRTSYKILSQAIVQLFKDNFTKIKNGSIKAFPQVNEGGSHKLKDKKPYEKLLRLGWDTPVSELIGKAFKEG